MIKKMVMESLLGNLVTFTRVIIKMMKEMDMVRCILQMELYIKVVGRGASKLE
jgi:hypothetical protein